MSTNTNRFTLFNEDEALAEEAKKFSCLYHKSSQSYRETDIVRNAWLGVAKKIKFFEDGMYF